VVQALTTPFYESVPSYGASAVLVLRFGTRQMCHTRYDGAVTTTGAQPDDIRDGLFLAASRTYGEQYVEPFLREVYGLTESASGDHDAISKDGTRFEIKAAKALRARQPAGDSIVERIIAEKLNTQTHRMVPYSLRYAENYNANIQNVKRNHFEFLLYAVLFSDRVVVFQAPVARVKQPDIPMWSDKHGRYDALGMSGQFNINKNTISTHEREFQIDLFTYDDLASIYGRL